MSRRKQKNVGVIGLGIIGSRVRDVLRRKGFHVFVWNRTPRPIPNFVGAPAELAEMCDYLQIFVSDDDALLQVVKQLSPGLGARHVIMAHSTVAPQTMVSAAEVVERRGARFVEAPFTGSKEAAEKGELVYYVGGEEAAMQAARPILEASSKSVMEIGSVGQATAIKLATNMVTAASIQAAAEALALVQSSGVPLEKFTAAMQGNASNSAVLSMKLPKMINGDFEPHFSVKHMLKDMQIASRLGLSHHLELGVSAAARDRLLEQMQRGHGDDDYSVVVQKYFPEAGTGGGSAESGLELFESQAPIPPMVAAEPEPDQNFEPLPELGQLAPIESGPVPATDIFTTPVLESDEESMGPVMQPSGQPVDEFNGADPEAVFAEEPLPDEEESAQQRGFLSRLLRR